MAEVFPPRRPASAMISLHGASFLNGMHVLMKLSHYPALSFLEKRESFSCGRKDIDPVYVCLSNVSVVCQKSIQPRK